MAAKKVRLATVGPTDYFDTGLGVVVTRDGVEVDSEAKAQEIETLAGKNGVQLVRIDNNGAAEPATDTTDKGGA